VRGIFAVLMLFIVLAAGTAAVGLLLYLFGVIG
jgi:hypothetical protein